MLKKINKLIDIWFPEILGNNEDVEDYIETQIDGGGTQEKFKHYFTARFIIGDNTYNISAIDANDKSDLKISVGVSLYSQCIICSGDFNYETWCKIKNKIITNELKKILPKPRR